MSTDHDAQKDEMLALESIFDMSEFASQELGSELSGKFSAFVTLPEGFKISYHMLPNFYPRWKKQKQIDREKQAEEFRVKYLPPLELSFTLPPDYPSTMAPRFTLTSCWLDRKQLSKLCQKLDALWEENKGLEILYLWISFLKEESYNFLGLTTTLDLSKQFTQNIKSLNSLKRMQQMQRTQQSPEAPVANASVVQVEIMKPETSVAGVANQGNGSNLRKFENRYPGRGRGRGRGRSKDKQKSDFVRPGDEAVVASGTIAQSAPNLSIEREGKSHENARGSNDSCNAPSYSGPANSDAGNRQKYFKKRENRKSFVNLDERAVSSVPTDIPLIDLLKEHNSIMTDKEFERNIFTCRICFDDKPGSQCLEFYECGHVFCRECVKGYFEVRIKEGNVQSMACLEEDCKSEALQKQVRETVGPELFARYDDLFLSTTLDLMDDIVYCPRKDCQYPVIKDGEDNMGLCPNCQYSFCILCKMGYHGVEPCRLKSEHKKELVAEYERSSSDRKSQLEAKYGRKQLMELVDITHSEEWISLNSKTCPHCQAAIQKADGCNKMICWRCGTNFCWICASRLDPKMPYLHFNSQTSPCFDMLFYGTFDNEFGDDDFDAEEFI